MAEMTTPGAGGLGAAPPPRGPSPSSSWRRYWLLEVPLLTSIFASPVVALALLFGPESHAPYAVGAAPLLASVWHSRPGGRYQRDAARRHGGRSALSDTRVHAGPAAAVRHHRGRVTSVALLVALDVTTSVLGPVTQRLPGWATVVAAALGVLHVVVLVRVVRGGGR